MPEVFVNNEVEKASSTELPRSSLDLRQIYDDNSRLSKQCHVDGTSASPADKHLPAVEITDGNKKLLTEETQTQQTLSDKYTSGSGDIGSLQPAIGQPRFNNFTVSGDLSKIDQNKPTVFFLDKAKYGEDGMQFNGYRLSHGEISALAAAKSGYNAILLDNHVDAKGQSKSLAEIAEAIQTKKLPLGPGDILNVSLGSSKPMPTFAELNTELSKFEKGISNYLKQQQPPLQLNLPIDADNLQKNSTALTKALEYVADNELRHSKWQQIAREATQHNKAIVDIQNHGVAIVHAAGNDGPGRVDLNYLEAQHQLTSYDAKAACYDPPATYNSNTEKADGVVSIYAQNSTDGKANGNYVMLNNGHQISFSAGDLAALNKESNNHPPSDQGSATVHLSADKKDVPRSEAGINELFTPITTNDGTILPPVLCGDNRNGRVPLTNGDKALIVVEFGTSFANIGWLNQNRQALSKQKEATTISNYNF